LTRRDEQESNRRLAGLIRNQTNVSFSGGRVPGARANALQTRHTLRPTGILRGLDHASLARISASCRWRSVDRDGEIIGLGVASTEVHFVASGRVRITIYSAGGREVAFRELGPGESFGQLAAIDGQARSASVLAVEDTNLASMSHELFFELMRGQPEVALNVMRELVALVRDLTNRIVDTTTLTVPVRVRRELLRMARASAVSGSRATILSAPTHAELANRIGGTREAVTRELNRLSRDKTIRREGRSIEVLDLRRLEDAAQGDSDG
jgi:CRP-like cAMP-binding protein